MANVYTVHLFGSSLTSDAITVSNPVPAGFVWVVRWVTTVAPGSPFTSAGGWELLDQDDFPIAGASSLDTWAGRVMQQETHQVVDAGGSLQFVAGGLDYAFNVTGYQLSLP